MFPVWSSPMLTVEFGHIWDMEISRVVLQIVFVAKKHKWIFPKKKKIRRPKSGVLVCFSLLNKIPEACSRFRLLEGPNGMVSQTWQEFWLHHSMGDKQKWDWIHAGGANMWSCLALRQPALIRTLSLRQVLISSMPLWPNYFPLLKGSTTWTLSHGRPSFQHLKLWGTLSNYGTG